MPATKTITPPKGKVKKQAAPPVTEEKPEPEMTAQGHLEAIDAIRDVFESARRLLVEEIYQLRTCLVGFREILEDGAPGDRYIGPFLWKTLMQLHAAGESLGRAFDEADELAVREKWPKLPPAETPTETMQTRVDILYRALGE